MVDLAAPPAIRGPADVTALLAAIEAEHPVERWTAGDLAVWPLVRTRLAHRLTRAMDGRSPRSHAVGASAVLRRAGAAARGLVQTPRTRELGPTGDGPHVLACSDGISFADGPVDRLLDPIRSRLTERGVGSTLVVPGHAIPPGLPAPVVSVQSALDCRLAAARLGRAPEVDLPGHADLRADLDRWGAADELADPATIAFAAAAVSAMAETFGRWINRTGAGLGLVVEWYALQGLAFVLACRRAGIPVVDVQHGVQGPLHYAYAAWDRCPAGGYALLPDRFWVWSDDEADTIAAWAPEGTGRSIVGGNLERSNFAAQASGRRPEGDTHVLVALAGEEADIDVDALLDTIAVAPGSWTWSLRCHPTDRTTGRWARALVDRGLGRVEVEASTHGPLFPLLATADVVVTAYSSVVLDALDLGVPAVVTDPAGVALYGHLVGRGVHVAVDPGSVVPAVEAALLDPPAPATRPDDGAAVDALVDLLEGAR